MADVFISYASEDRERIRPLVRRLEDEGWSVWWDRELVAGPSFEDEIEKALDASACVLVAWSEHSVRSSWCRAEANEAVEGQRLVPAVIDTVRPPLRFREAHTASLIGWPEETGEIEVLLDGVRACVARRHSDTAAAQSSAGSDTCLAVLPFDNLSMDAELQYFSDGISEEIMRTVAATAATAVIGRSSSFQFRGADKAASNVAAELACTHVLDGSVRRSGNRVRISAQLIDCRTQTTLWTERFDRELADVFALQDEIAAAVASALQVAFTPAPGAVPVDPEAYDLYLRAKIQSTQWLGAQDINLLERAVARAPEFALAWSALAISRAIEFHMERDAQRALTVRTQTIEAASNALRLDPGLGMAHAALSITEPICGRFEARSELIDRALADSPNDPTVLFWASRWTWATGHINASAEYARRIRTADPLWPQGLHQYRQMLLLTGRDEESWALWHQLIERWPRLPYLYAAVLPGAAVNGDWQRVDEIVDALRRSGLPMQVDPGEGEQVPGTERYDFDRILRDVDRIRHWSADDTHALGDTLAAEVDRTGTLRLYVQWACELDLTDHVYTLVERASFAHLFEPGGRLHPRDYGLHALWARVGAGTFQRDPRFVRLCARLGLARYWTQTGRWPDCADELDREYNFRREAAKLAGLRG